MKGQSSIEFLAFVSLSAFFLAALTTVMVNKQDQTVQFSNRLDAEKVAEHVSFQVELALVHGDGYSRVFSVPERIGGRNYTVRLLNGSSKLSWGNNSVIQPSRYRGEELNLTAGESNIFMVVNDGGEVSLFEK